MLWIKPITLQHSMATHHHAMHEFLVCLKGKLQIDTGDQSVLLTKGSAVFIPSEKSHHIECVTDQVQVLMSCIDPVSLQLIRSPSNRIFIETLEERISESHCDASKPDELYQSALFAPNPPEKNTLLAMSFEENRLLKMLLLHANRMKQEHEATSTMTQQIEGVLCWMKEHYSSDISLDSLVHQFGISRSQLSRKFRIHTGASVVDYLIKIRSEAAALQLATSDKDISDVALDTGFNNLSHFHRQFKRRFGMTPLTFRLMTKQIPSN